MQKPFKLESQQSSITENIRRAFEEEQTDGILKLSQQDFAPDVDDLVSATLEAVEEKNGHVASILNGFIGACSLMEDKTEATSRVCELLEAYEELEEEKGITPDIVSYSLAFNALSLDPTATDLAETALERALKMSKKTSGSKRRKALAASRRKKTSSSFSSVESELQELLGDDFRVLYETDDFFVISKPSGVSCFHKKTTTAGKVKRGKGNKPRTTSDVSLEDALLTFNVPLSTLNPEGLGLVHRLDRGSSGCMVLAKTEEMHAKLLSEFFLRRSEKTYVTIVSPAPEQSLPYEGHIDLPVDRRPAKSKYTILERYGTAAAMLQFDIYTGRKHQVRVHAAEGLSSSVLLDGQYASKDSNPLLPDGLLNENDSKSKFFLHASSLSIPEYGIDSEAPIPSWWDPVIQSLKHQ
jgi:23S rRNA pseudouridine1911/1915/1917 synthase